MFRITRKHLPVLAVMLRSVCSMETAQAQLTDNTQTPNTENAGNIQIIAAWQQSVRASGMHTTPGSSTFITFSAIRPGQSGADASCSRENSRMVRASARGSGRRRATLHANAAIGAGLIDSCAGCHGRPRGSAGFGGDVFTKPDGRDAPHLFGLGLQEMLADEMTGRAARP